MKNLSCFRINSCENILRLSSILKRVTFCLCIISSLILISACGGTCESDFYGKWKMIGDKDDMVDSYITFYKDNTFKECNVSKSVDENGSNIYTVTIEGRWAIAKCRNYGAEREYLWKEYDVNSISISGNIDTEERVALKYIYKKVTEMHNEQLYVANKNEDVFYGWGVPCVKDDMIVTSFPPKDIAIRVRE